MKKKQEIKQWRELHRQEIILGELIVFFQDECHLLWGDVCGYVWGKSSERIEVPMTNEPQKQTYYGALNLHTQEFVVQAYKAGNSESTIEFLKALLEQNPQSRIAMIWDGASYHRSQAVKDYLDSVNQGLEESQWKITCIRFTPNDPRQNPVEDVWLQAKRFVREFYHLCQSFSCAKYLFELVTRKRRERGSPVILIRGGNATRAALAAVMRVINVSHYLGSTNRPCCVIKIGSRP